MKHILYSFRRCPYAMRARMALVYAKIVVELREIELRNKPKALLVISPKGTVPVLQLDDGRVLEESLDIMLWAMEESDPGHWFRVDSNKQQAMLDLIADNDNHFKQVLDRYKYPERYDDIDPIAQREKGLQFLTGLEGRLQRQAFLFGETTSLADIAVFPFVRQFARVDETWFLQQALPKLQHWLDFYLQSDLFAVVMRKFKTWQPDDAAVIFPDG